MPSNYLPSWIKEVNAIVLQNWYPNIGSNQIKTDESSQPNQYQIGSASSDARSSFQCSSGSDIAVWLLDLTINVIGWFEGCQWESIFGLYKMPLRDRAGLPFSSQPRTPHSVLCWPGPMVFVDSPQIILNCTSLVHVADPAGSTGYDFVGNHAWVNKVTWDNLTYAYLNVSGASLRKASVIIRFSGTHITVFGSADGPFEWTMDDNPPSESSDRSYGHDMPFLVNSTMLNDTDHSLRLGNFTNNVTVSHSLVTPGSNTLVSFDYLRVHHTDSSITYSGHWKEGGLVDSRYSQQSSRIVSAIAGDMMVILLDVCASSLRILGSFDSSVDGNLTLAVSVNDGLSDIRTFNSHTQNTTDNFIPYEIDFTDHDGGSCFNIISTSILNVTGGQSFSFGSYDYVAAFDRFPPSDLAANQPSSSSISISSISSSSFSSSIPSIFPSTTDGPTTSSTESPRGSGPALVQQGKASPVAPVVGGIIGVGFLMAGIMIATLLLRRRKRKIHPTNLSIATPFIYTERSDSIEFLPYDGYDSSSGYPNAYWRRAGRTFAEKVRERALPAGTQSTAFPETGGLGSLDPQDEDDEQPLLTSNGPPNAPDPPSGAPERPVTQDVTVISRRMLELMQSLRLDVNELRRPPAYDEAA